MSEISIMNCINVLEMWQADSSNNPLLSCYYCLGKKIILFAIIFQMCILVYHWKYVNWSDFFTAFMSFYQCHLIDSSTLPTQTNWVQLMFSVISKAYCTEQHSVYSAHKTVCTVVPIAKVKANECMSIFKHRC